MAQTKITSVQLSDSGVAPGPYTSANITVDAAGRITAAANGSSGGVTSISVAGTAGRLTSSGSPVTTSGTVTLDLATTTVTPGAYTSSNITIDAYGRITAAANGSSGGVTSISVAGTAGRLTSSGSPVTTSGTITLDLATTAVTPGAYTSSNITIDAYGRITAAANGSSVPSLTDNQIAFGSPLNVITSTADFTYDDLTGTLEVGPTGSPALVAANTGQSITVEGDTGARFKSGLNTFGINSTGTVLVNASAGTIGQVLTSLGPGNPTVWAAGGGGSPDVFTLLLSPFAGTFDGVVNTTWGATVLVPASYCEWDSYLSNILFNQDGYYKVTIVGSVSTVLAPFSWPAGMSTFGTTVTSSVLQTNSRQALNNGTVNGNGDTLFDLAAYLPAPDPLTAVWTDSYVCERLANETQEIGLYAASYANQFAAASLSAVVTVEYLGPAGV